MSDGFTCPRCGMTSHNPKDAEYGWCSACEDFTEQRAGLTLLAQMPGMEELRRRLEAKLEQWGDAWAEVLRIASAPMLCKHEWTRADDTEVTTLGDGTVVTRPVVHLCMLAREQHGDEHICMFCGDAVEDEP